MRQLSPVLLVLGGMFLGACVAPQLGPKASVADTQPTKWEYDSIALSANTLLDPEGTLEARLNKVGAEGWDLVLVSGDRVYIKRPKTN